MSSSNVRSRNYERKKKYKSKRTGEEKIIIDVCLPIEIFHKLQEIAHKLYPDISRGRISYALADIIEFYYAWHAHKHTQRSNPRRTTREEFNAVLRELERRMDYIPRQAPNFVLWDAICLACGITDPRAVRKRFYRFTIEGLIKPLTACDITKLQRNWRVVWEIVATKA